MIADSGGSDARIAIDWPALRWLFTFVRPYRGQLLSLLALSAFTSSLVLVQPYFTKLLIDEGLLAGRYDILLWMAGTIFGVGLLATLLSGANRYFYTRMSGTVLFDLREYVYRHLQTLSPSFYGRHRGGDILSRLDGDVAEIQRFAVDSLFAALSALLGLVGTVAFMLLLNWKLTLLLLAVVPLQWLYLKYMRARVQKHTRRIRERSSDLSAFLMETLPAMKYIQSVGAQAREAGRLGVLNRAYLGDLLQLQLVEFATSAVPSTLTALARAVVLVLGGYWVIEGQMQLGALIAFTTYLGMAQGPVQGLLGLYMSMHRIQVCLQRVRYLVESEADVHETGQQEPPEILSCALCFDNVDFTYPGTARTVLREASLTIPAGSKLGLQSPSGSGKSTLVDLLLRHYDPQCGRILVDSVDIRDFALSAWRGRIALVAQDIQIFAGNLMDNIRYARPEATEAQVREAVKLAQLEPLVDGLPQGLFSPVSERGISLSGGERQRIAIARALLQRPLLVILDEATSAVDEAVEREVMQAVDELFSSCTRLVISHRASALANCDHLVTVEDGSLLELCGSRAHG